jgi:hypothetical protein
MNSMDNEGNECNGCAQQAIKARKMQQLLTKSFTDNESTEYKAAHNEVNRQWRQWMHQLLTVNSTDNEAINATAAHNELHKQLKQGMQQQLTMNSTENAGSECIRCSQMSSTCSSYLKTATSNIKNKKALEFLWSKYYVPLSTLKIY